MILQNTTMNFVSFPEFSYPGAFRDRNHSDSLEEYLSRNRRTFCARAVIRSWKRSRTRLKMRRLRLILVPKRGMQFLVPIEESARRATTRKVIEKITGFAEITNQACAYTTRDSLTITVLFIALLCLFILLLLLASVHSDFGQVSFARHRVIL